MLKTPEDFLAWFPTLLEGSKLEDAGHLLAILNPLRVPRGQVLIERGDFAASITKKKNRPRYRRKKSNAAM